MAALWHQLRHLLQVEGEVRGPGCLRRETAERVGTREQSAEADVGRSLAGECGAEGCHSKKEAMKGANVMELRRAGKRYQCAFKVLVGENKGVGSLYLDRHATIREKSGRSRRPRLAASALAYPVVNRRVDRKEPKQRLPTPYFSSLSLRSRGPGFAGPGLRGFFLFMGGREYHYSPF